MVDPNRLVDPQFDLQTYFSRFVWNRSHEVMVPQGGIIMVDPIYLADIYNEGSAIANVVRTLGTLVHDFGGDASGPLWHLGRHVLMPISMHYAGLPEMPPGATVLCDRIGCDSGSFVLLPFSESLPSELRDSIRSCLEERNAVLLKLPVGKWELKFEQFDPPQANMVALYRNIVLVHTVG